MRKERSLPILEKLSQCLEGTLSGEPPSSVPAKASSYTFSHWDALTRFVNDGRFLLDNDITEQQMRDVALGRKNFHFAGSHNAARRAAVVYSVLRTSPQHGVPPYEYLLDVMPRLVGGAPVEEVLPDRSKLSSGKSAA